MICFIREIVFIGEHTNIRRGKLSRECKLFALYSGAIALTVSHLHV